MISVRKNFQHSLFYNFHQTSQTIFPRQETKSEVHEIFENQNGETDSRKILEWLPPIPERFSKHLRVASTDSRRILETSQGASTDSRRVLETFQKSQMGHYRLPKETSQGELHRCPKESRNISWGVGLHRPPRDSRSISSQGLHQIPEGFSKHLRGAPPTPEGFSRHSHRHTHTSHPKSRNSQKTPSCPY